MVVKKQRILSVVIHVGYVGGGIGEQIHNLASGLFIFSAKIQCSYLQNPPVYFEEIIVLLILTSFFK